MDFFVPPQEISYRYSDYIEEFQAILAASKIKFGSPDNFTVFARRLQSDDVLSADLDRMVRSIIQRETGNISLRTILTIIAVASGGPTAADPNRDFSKPKQLVIDAMIASGGCSPADAEHLDGLCRSAPAIQSHETTPPNEASPDITGSLTRLELNASEAMHYLDSIEQRIARMEPFLEALPFSETPASSPAVAPAPPPLVEPPFIPAELPTNTSHIRITLNDSIDRFADFLFTRKFEFRNNFFTGTFTRRPFGVTFPSRFFSYTFAYKFFRYRVTDKLFSYPFVHKLLHNKFIQRAVAVPLSLAAVVGTTLLYLSIEHNHHPVIQPPTASTTEASVIPPITITNKPQLTVTADLLDKSTNEPSVKQQPHKPSPYLSQTSTVPPSHPQRLTEPAPASSSSSAAAATAPAASYATAEDETPTP